MGANQNALAALNAELFIPHGNLLRDVPFLPFGGPGWKRPINRESADGQIISMPADDRAEDVMYKNRSTLRDRRKNIETTIGLFWNGDGMQMRERVIHSRIVLLHNCFPALAIGFANCLLDRSDCLGSWKHAANRKETRLHDCVDAASHSGVASHGITINHEEF